MYNGTVGSIIPFLARFSFLSLQYAFIPLVPGWNPSAHFVLQKSRESAHIVNETLGLSAGNTRRGMEDGASMVSVERDECKSEGGGGHEEVAVDRGQTRNGRCSQAR